MSAGSGQDGVQELAMALVEGGGLQSLGRAALLSKAAAAAAAAAQLLRGAQPQRNSLLLLRVVRAAHQHSRELSCTAHGPPGQPAAGAADSGGGASVSASAAGTVKGSPSFNATVATSSGSSGPHGSPDHIWSLDGAGYWFDRPRGS